MNRIEQILKLAAQIEPLWPRIVASSELSDPRTLQCRAEAPARPNSRLRDELRAVDSDISEARDRRAEAQRELDSAKETLAGKDGRLDTSSDDFQSAKEARRRVGEIDDEIAQLQANKVDLLELLGQQDPEVEKARREAQRDRRPGENQGWNTGHMFTPDVTAELAMRANSKARHGNLDFGTAIDRDALVADVGATAEMRRGTYYGVLPQLTRPLRVLDLIPTSTMDGNTLPYTQESGNFDDGVAETPEGEQKPQAGITYEDKSAEAETIATFMKIRKQVLSDVPALQGIIDNRLRYMVLRRLQKQVLNGSGNAGNLEGILQVDGLGEVPYDGSELKADQLLSGITTILLSEGEADGIVLNPLDWEDILKAKASGGDEQYYGGGPFRSTPQVAWGVPLIADQAIPRGQALVADFMLGAQLFIREGVNVLLSDSDQDDFIRNKVTLLGEMRAALAVWRPSVFCVVELEQGS